MLYKYISAITYVDYKHSLLEGRIDISTFLIAAPWDVEQKQNLIKYKTKLIDSLITSLVTAMDFVLTPYCLGGES